LVTGTGLGTNNHAAAIGVSDDLPTCAWALAGNRGAARTIHAPQFLADEAVAAIMTTGIDVAQAVLDMRQLAKLCDAGTSLVVIAAASTSSGPGYDIAGVGDYGLYHCQGGDVVPLMSSLQPNTPTGDEEASTFATGMRITRLRAPLDRERLVVMSGSVARAVTAEERAALITGVRNPQTCAHDLFQAGVRAGMQQNAALLVLDPLSTE